MDSKELAKQRQTKFLATVKSEKLAEQMANSLADNDPQTVRRIVACITNAAMKTPALYESDAQSVMKVMLDCCSLGIEPNGRDAHILPYRGKNGTIAQLILDYKGMITLATKSERVASIRAEVVCANDDFSWCNGAIEHRINWMKPRGEMCAVYAVALYKDGHSESAVMHKSEVDSIRARSRAANAGPWVTDYNEMAKKTAVRRLSKYLPLSPAAVAAINYDDEQSFDFNTPPPSVGTATAKASADDLIDALSVRDAEEPEVVEEPKPPKPAKNASGEAVIDVLFGNTNLPD